MAEHPDEVREVTETSQALVLNLGNITDVRMKSMIISTQVATETGIPIVLDLVGVACSKLRRNFALNLIKKYPITVIKGNYSEIKALFDGTYSSPGVDTDLSLKEDSINANAKWLANKYNAIVLASGKTDIVTDGNRFVYIKNGTPQLAEITGTGCMLGAVCGCFVAVEQSLKSVVVACVTMGICGELSVTDKGSGSFIINLIDKLSVINNIKEGALVYEE